MVIKTMSRKSGIKGLLTYLFKDKEKLEHDGQPPITIRKNLRKRSLEKWVKEFEDNEALRIYKRKDSVKAYHTVISFSNKDSKHITSDVIEKIARQYMKLRGNDNLYLVTAHFDKSHVHIHIAEGGTKYMIGKANRLSKKKYQELKIAMQEYQKKKFPQLQHSLPKHGKGKKDVAISTHRKTGQRKSQKEILISCLQSADKKATSLEAFLTLLKEAGHEPYYRSGRLTGLKYEGGMKFRFSRLGFDKARLEELEELTDIEKQQLEELETLRSGYNSKDRGNESTNQENEEDVISDDMEEEEGREDDYSR